ncbi:hypothetical protein N7495_000306 [Penicillium taxi]|uniref:uncharacterized protein n=1 Tax=Penicillium taxi TaxID=168475 RepID=UPI0025450AB7|nr:uncharacterized protein N7495_000306 [Penicillium taxi]KAJ5907624.1 hypothetical protein N7495_000306 [Penicillium taxi]
MSWSTSQYNQQGTQGQPQASYHLQVSLFLPMASYHEIFSANGETCSCHYGSKDVQTSSFTPDPSPPPYQLQQQQQQQYGENASYYQHNIPAGDEEASQIPEQTVGDRGLGSTISGGAAGGYTAHQMGGGKLATAGGALLGAVGMNMVSNKLYVETS